jgi:hypothetical protein
MNEWNTPERKHETSLDDQLAAYYWQEIPEQPLPPAAWHKLRAKLPRQRPFRYRPLHIRRRCIRFIHVPPISYGGAAPVYIQDAFNRIAHEAQLPYTSAMLHCTFKKQVRIPSVRVSYWGKQKIHLLLPASPTSSLEPSELNVLLASGLACYLCLFERKPPFGLVRMLTVWVCLLALIALILVGWHKFTPAVFPIAVILLAILLCTLVLSHRQGRALAFRVDALSVQWLGRSQMCQGLHTLVRRSHHPQRKGLGQVSFAERIQRVCGMQIPVENERLTLVH